MEFAFDAPVQLLSYTPGFVSQSAWILTVAQGANSSVETNFVDEQPTDFASQFVVIANQAITVSTNFNGQLQDQTLQWRTITVETDPNPGIGVQSVPVPALGPIGLILLSGLINLVFWFRRRSS